MTRVALATVTGLVVVGGLLAGCSGSDGNPTAGSGTSATASAQPTGSSTTPGGTTSGPSASTSSAPTTGVAGSARPTHKAQPLRSTATFGSGVTVHVSSVKAVTVKGRGPGELSGSAVAITLQLHNGTPTTLDLGNAVVTASYGKAATPAVDSSSPPSKPWTGSVKAGQDASATYVWLVPKSSRGSVELNVSYDPTKPVVLLRGDASA
ncbi:hypothetical protein [Angustibacter luteus]|uniref:DUF4352 domain-containing protein n=1 Tax=Angustibacter luteus TaxID=658456 RepID=A0ABW1JC33_9ACTN